MIVKSIGQPILGHITYNLDFPNFKTFDMTLKAPYP